MPQVLSLDPKAVVNRTPPEPDQSEGGSQRYRWEGTRSLRILDSWLESLSDTDDVGSVNLDRTEDSSDVEEAPPPVHSAALQNLIARWAAVAVSHATCLSIDDPPGLIATVVGVEGAWGFGGTRGEALEDLHSVLTDWATLKLRDNDNDIPSMEGVHLVVRR